jgi:hypothetical protein
VQETRRRSTIAAGDIGAVFAAAPPLECLRIVCSLVMSSDPSQKWVIRFLDISRAHPSCKIHRKVFIVLPPEDPRSQEEGICGLLEMALCGTRDAGQNFEMTVAETCEKAECDRGVFCVCVYSHRGRQLFFFHHGDDFVLGGPRESSEWMRQELSTVFIIKDRGVLGPEPGDKREITCLNRVVRWTDRMSAGGESIEYEADTRHAQILQAQMGLKPTSRGLSTPGVSVAVTPETETEVDAERATVFRSACMRLGYLAMDRPEMQFSAKECARGMSSPTERHWGLLKRACRFTLEAGRVVWRWNRQRMPKTLDVYSDTDWAGCPLTRRSTSCFVAKLGQHTTVTGSTTQIPIALSSGEAEFYGGVRAASRLIGLGSLLCDFGFDSFDKRLFTDSTAALGIMQRRGCGKVRHLETPTLWVQKALKDGRFGIAKVPGKQNPADVGTKHLDQATMKQRLELMNLRIVNEALHGALHAKLG